MGRAAASFRSHSPPNPPLGALPVRRTALMAGPCRSVAGLRWKGIAGPSHGRTISFAPQTPRWGASAPLRGGHYAPPLLRSQAPSVATSLRAVRRSRMRIERAAQLAAGCLFAPAGEAWLLLAERTLARFTPRRLRSAPATSRLGRWRSRRRRSRQGLLLR